MTDFSGTPTSQTFWTFDAAPGHPLIVERIERDGPVEVARYEVTVPAKVSPDAKVLGLGLYLVSYDANIGNGFHAARRYYIVFGPYSILYLGEGLAGAVRAVVQHDAAWRDHEVKP